MYIGIELKFGVSCPSNVPDDKRHSIRLEWQRVTMTGKRMINERTRKFAAKFVTKTRSMKLALYVNRSTVSV